MEENEQQQIYCDHCNEQFYRMELYFDERFRQFKCPECVDIKREVRYL